ncbi:hypothetical protein AB6A40_003044 [Gnathostoma spinigerum]|uniref:Archease domain-containing protein n=1 Tax=Gnathostoma spinigerum TaxID=75299 RepID=A0ABD6EJ68_9BILA
MVFTCDDCPPVAEVKYEYLDHTADVQLHGWGENVCEAIEQVLISMYGYMTDITSVSVAYSFDLKATGIDMESMLARILDEALFFFSTEPLFVGRVAKVLSLDRETWTINVRCWGESFDLSRHPQGTEVKAITYSNMQIHEKPGRSDIYVIIDI